MGSVNEARYTLWHTIVDLAKASEMPKVEWCRKNFIPIKTLNHYEGIFKRQEGREDSYNNREHLGLQTETFLGVPFWEAFWQHQKMEERYKKSW